MEDGEISHFSQFFNPWSQLTRNLKFWAYAKWGYWATTACAITWAVYGQPPSSLQLSCAATWQKIFAHFKRYSFNRFCRNVLRPIFAFFLPHSLQDLGKIFGQNDVKNKIHWGESVGYQASTLWAATLRLPHSYERVHHIFLRVLFFIFWNSISVLHVEQEKRVQEAEMRSILVSAGLSPISNFELSIHAFKFYRSFNFLNVWNYCDYCL